MDNPYRSPESIPVEPKRGKSVGERLALALVFLICAFPLASTSILNLMESMTFGDGHTYFRIAPANDDLTWLGWAMSIALFVAGLGAIFRRRWSIPIFGGCLFGFIVASLAMGWHVVRITAMVCVACCLAYLIVLNRRGRLS